MDLPEWRQWWLAEGREQLTARLLEDWDPIGIRKAPEAADEYEDYVSQLGRMLRSGSPPEEIARHLSEIETEQMGLEADRPERLLKIAQKLCDWHRRATAGRTGSPRT